MNRRWLVLAVAFSGCFSEPPASESGDSSGAGSSSVTDPGSEDSTSSSTAPTDGTTAGPSSGSTTDVSSTTDPTTSGDDTAGDAGGNPPRVEFCGNQGSPNLIACRDFDSQNPLGWGAYKVEGFTRMEDSMRPPAHSAPNFATIRRSGSKVVGDAAQALFGTDFAPAELQGASVGLQVRFPLNFAEVCGSVPVRLFEIRYGESAATTSIVMEASPDEVVVHYFSPLSNPEIGRFPVDGPPPAGGWHRVDLELIFGSAGDDATFAIGGELVAPPTISGFEFSPVKQDVSVNVGPWFASADAPATGCGYDLDDLRLEGIAVRG